MAPMCTVPGTGYGFLKGTLDFIDCQTLAIGEQGYRALADPASPAALILAALITLFVAVIGIRMLIGERFEAGSLIPIALKLGLVLALAGSWAAYRVVAYDVVLRGPAELLGSIAEPSGLQGSAGLVDRLQAVDDAIVAFTAAGTISSDATAPIDPRTGESLMVRSPVSNDIAFGTARLAYLVGSIGTLGLMRLAAGMLLALAPLFAGLLLFETTRGLFMGWLRMLFASALGALGVTLVLIVALAFLEPWLSNVLALRAARIATPSAPLELLVMTLAFALIAVGMVVVALRVAFGSSIMIPARLWVSPRKDDVLPQPSRAESPMLILARDTPAMLSRAQIIAASMRGGDMTNALTTRAQTVTDALARSNASNSRSAGTAPVRLGQGHRRTARRVSQVATVRSAR